MHVRQYLRSGKELALLQHTLEMIRFPDYPPPVRRNVWLIGGHGRAKQNLRSPLDRLAIFSHEVFDGQLACAVGVAGF